MTRILLAAALLALVVPATGRADDADAEKQVATLSKQHREATVKGDTEALDAILDGEAHEETRREVLAHLEECAVCREELAYRQLLRRAIHCAHGA